MLDNITKLWIRGTPILCDEEEKEIHIWLHSGTKEIHKIVTTNSKAVSLPNHVYEGLIRRELIPSYVKNIEFGGRR